MGARTEVVSDREFDVLVVLGKNWRRDRSALSVDSKMNALAVGELYCRNEAAAIIFSGGQTAGAEKPSEAAAMHAFFRRFFSPADVPAEVVILEERSIDTADNAARVRALLQARGLTGVGLLTTRRHLPAARRIFEAFDIPITRIYAAEDVLLARSRWYPPFIRQLSSSWYARIDRGLEGARRVLLLIDPRGKSLRPLTRVLRHGEKQ